MHIGFTNQQTADVKPIFSRKMPHRFSRQSALAG
jgi:hypothetical protein